MNFRKQWKALLLSFVSALLMIRITFFVLNFVYVWFDEQTLIEYSAVTKNLVLGLEEKPDSNRFLFVNVAWEKALTDKMEKIDEDFEIPIGTQAITDRGKLIEFFKILNLRPNNHKFVICDIRFLDKTEHDSTLAHYINKLPNTLVSYHLDDNKKPEYPVVPIKKSKLGLSDIEKSGDKLFKYKIFYNDSIKTTALKMYEILYGKKFKQNKLWFDKIGDKMVLSYFILDYRVRNFDYVNERYSKVNLSETFLNLAIDPFAGMEDEEGLEEDFGDEDFFPEEGIEGDSTPEEGLEEDTLTEENLEELDFEEDTLTEENIDDLGSETDAIPEDSTSENNTEEVVDEKYAGYDMEGLESLYELMKDRIIIVGDFVESDIHQTIYGDTPGPLILLDAFLAIEAGDNEFSMWFLVFLFLAYFWISYRCFSLDNIFGPMMQKFLPWMRPEGFIATFPIYALYFSVISLIGFFVFRIHISVFMLSVYMFALEQVKVFFIKRKTRRTKLVFEAHGIQRFWIFEVSALLLFFNFWYVKWLIFNIPFTIAIIAHLIWWLTTPLIQIYENRILFHKSIYPTKLNIEKIEKINIEDNKVSFIRGKRIIRLSLWKINPKSRTELKDTLSQIKPSE